MTTGKKGDLDFVMSANPDKAIADMAKMVAKQEASIAKLKEANREAKKAATSTKSMGSPMGKIAKDAASIATGFLTAQGAIAGATRAVGLLKAEFEDLKRKQSEAATANMTYAKNFVPAIQGWLGGGAIDKADVAFKKVLAAEPALGADAMTKMIGSYSGARPGATLGEGVTAVGMGAKLPFMDQALMMSVVGELQQMYPGKNVEDVFDIAIGMQGRAGKYAKDIPSVMKGANKLTAMGLSADEAMGIAMASFETEQGPRALSTLSTLLATPVTVPKKIPGKKLTAEQVARRELAGMSTSERFGWMQANPDLAADVYKTTWASVGPLMRPGAIAAGVDIVRSAQTQDLYRGDIAAVKGSVQGQKLFLGAENTAEIDKLQLGYGKGALVGQVRSDAEALLKTVPALGKTQREMVMAATEFEGFFGGDYASSSAKQLRRLSQRYSRETIPDAGYISLTGGYGDDLTKPNPNYDPALVNVIERLIDRIEKWNDLATREQGMRDQVQISVPAGAME